MHYSATEAEIYERRETKSMRRENSQEVLTLEILAYRTGTTTSVSNVEEINPPIVPSDSEYHRLVRSPISRSGYRGASLSTYRRRPRTILRCTRLLQVDI